MTARIEHVAAILAAADAEACAVGLSDSFMQMAQALDDAGLLAPTPLPDARLAEIACTVPSGYEGPWYFQPAEDGRRWVVGYPTDCPDAGLIATVPDYGMHLAEFIAAARNAVPELVREVKRLRAEVERLTPKPQVGVTNVRVTETARAGWQVRYRLDGVRKSQRNFPSKERADAWVGQQRKKHGGAK